MNVEWISVEKDTPKKGQLIITSGINTVFEDNVEIHSGRWDESLVEVFDGKRYCGDVTVDSDDGYVTVSKVTHWMKCPKYEEE